MFTLAAVNTSAAVVSGASGRDELSAAFARSDLVPPLAPGLSLAGTELTWTIPPLQPEESVLVTYTLHVRSDAEAGPLPNAVVPFGAGGGCLVCETTHTIVPGLPPTGVILPIGIATTGGLLLIAGVLVWMIGRRRRDRVATRG